jgi:hypothetical protein
MAKIPVGPSIAYAYGFAFAHAARLLRLTALPLILMMLAIFVVYAVFPQAMNPGAAQFSPGPLFATWGIMMPAMIIGTTMILVGVTEEVLVSGLPPGTFYFSFGRPAWRLAGGFVLRIATFCLAMFLILIVWTLITVAVRQSAGESAPILQAVLFVMLMLVMAYLWQRLLFFAAPVAVAEGAIGVRRSWRLARGNVLRSFIVVMAVVLPWMVLYMAAYGWFFASAMPSIGGDGATPAELGALYMERARELQSYWYVTVPVGTFLSAFFYAMPAAAAAYAYKSMTGTVSAAEAAKTAEVF